MAAVLIIEDELVLAHELSLALESAGHEVAVATTAGDGLERAATMHPDLVLLDLRLPDRSGLDLIGDLLARDANLLIVLMTAYGSTREAVEAIRRGAADYLHKPLDAGELGLLIARLLRAQRQRRELEWLRREGAGPPGLPGENGALRTLYDEVARLCDSSLPPGRRPPILLTGETGVGMRFVARRIHDQLGGGPFIEVPCDSFAGPELEKELFGTEGGAEGGTRAGLFEAAVGGTLLLREISRLDPSCQLRLLDLLESKHVCRVGSSRRRELDVHLITTTHRNLGEEVAAGRFEAELLVRIRGLYFELPPLRERGEELVQIARCFAREFGVHYRNQPCAFTPEAESRLLRYSWPGNLGELRNVVERAVLLSEETEISEDGLASLLERGVGPGGVVLPERGVRLDDVERELIRQALERAHGNQTRASALLGLSRDTFRYRMAKWGLEGHGEAT